MDSAEVSLLLNVWGGDDPNLLRKSIESINNQDFAPSEVVVIVDGPVGVTTRQILEEFEHRSMGRCRVIHLPVRQGLWSARNEGLKACTGRWIALHDADDVMHPARLRILHELASQDTFDVVSSGVMEIERPSGRILGIKRPPIGPDELRLAMRMNNPINHPTVLLRREKVLSLGGYRDIYCAEDYDLWLRLFANSARFCQVDLPLTLFSTGRGQIRRRGGRRFVRSEWSLASLKISIGLTGKLSGGAIFLVRLTYRLVPGFLRSAAQGRYVSRLERPRDVRSEADYLQANPMTFGFGQKDDVTPDGPV